MLTSPKGRKVAPDTISESGTISHMKALDSLRKNSVRKLDIPARAAKTLNDYLHLKIDSAEVTTPYHINPGLKSRNSALLGKGGSA